MPTDSDFRALIQRVRSGEEAAATELVQQYEPAIRRVVRMRLTDPSIRQVLDSMDICQSVLTNFFIRVAAGQFELNTPQELLNLLATMARNKLHDQVRRQQADRRDVRRRDSPKALEAVADDQITPSRNLANKELLEQARRLLSEEERFLIEQRSLGREWADIAADVGGSPAALRMKLGRALDRVARQLGLDEVSE